MTKNFLSDPMCALQLGHAILMEKPIILLVDKELKIPQSLVKVAQRIERLDYDDPAMAKRSSEVIKRVHGQDRKER